MSEDKTALQAPAEQLPNSFSRFLRSPDVEGFERDYPYLISAVDDNRPFFFYTVQPRELNRFVKSYLSARARKAGEADYKINAAIPALFALFLVSITATGMILLLPPLIRGTQLPRERNPRRFLWYFLAIGMGYILIEIALIQKCVLFLGHPTYALTVILFSMLVSSGVGSYYSGRVLGSNDRRLSAHLIVVAVLVGGLSILLAPVMSGAVGLPLSIKILITICLISPAGVAMGMPFPTGLRRLERLSPRSVRWAWSLNAAASVLGSVSAITLAIYFGLRVTLLAGGAAYLFAAAAVWATQVAQTGRAKQTAA